MGIFDFTIYQLIQRNAKIYSDRSALISGDLINQSLSATGNFSDCALWDHSACDNRSVPSRVENALNIAEKFV